MLQSYPPPRLSRRACHQAGPSLFCFTFLSPVLARLSWIASEGSPGMDRLAWIAWNGSPGMDRLSWIASPGTPCLDSLERIPWNGSPGKYSFRAGPARYSGFSRLCWESPHGFLCSSFLACFSTPSRAPLFRSWHRKTSQNGAQTLPKSGPKRSKIQCYVANAEK